MSITDSTKSSTSSVSGPISVSSIRNSADNSSGSGSVVRITVSPETANPTYPSSVSKTPAVIRFSVICNLLLSL